LCATNEKLIQHLFFDCVVSYLARNLFFFKLLGLITTQHNKTSQHFDLFYMFTMNIKDNKI